MSRTMAMFALLLAGLLAACGGSSGSGGTGGGGGSSDPGAGSSDMGGGIIDALYSSPEMESLLPTNVDGMAFTISSFDYSKIPLDQAAQAFGDASLEGWLGKTGKNWTDVRWASGSTDLTGEKTATITVMRVIGADSAAILDWWGGSSFNMGDGATTVNLGGKTVQKVSYPGLPTVIYQWVKGDTLYWVVAGPESFGDAVVTATK